MEQALDVICPSPEELPVTAEKLLRFAGDRKVFLFYAQMGAGKTTCIKHLCKHLGSTDNFSSPTFSIVNEYSSPNGKLYHFDLYRIKHIEELYDLGIEEYLDSGAYCFVEWPELLEQVLKEAYLKINITTKGNSRYFHALKP
jgi:tRNA threonylcarbamoyladenosine biosynthesis protein TsaE